MMRRLLVATLAIALVLTAAATASADPIGGTGWTLVFNDDFSGSTVDTAKWNYRTDVKAYSSQKPENVTLGGGVMSINLKQEADRGKNFTGGGLVSKQQLRYGYYETRTRINNGSGWHTAFYVTSGVHNIGFGLRDWQRPSGPNAKRSWTGLRSTRSHRQPRGSRVEALSLGHRGPRRWTKVITGFGEPNSP